MASTALGMYQPLSSAPDSRDAVNGIHRVKQAHGRGGGQVNAAQGLLQGDDAAQISRHIGSLWNDQEICSVRNGNQGVAILIAVEVKTLGILQGSLVFVNKAVNVRRIRLSGNEKGKKNQKNAE